MATLAVNITPTDIETFTQYFKNQDVRIAGTFEDPLFHMRDVTLKIGDEHNYDRHIPDNIVKIIEVPTEHLTQIENIIKCLAKSSDEYRTYINLHELIATNDINKYYELVHSLL